MKLQKWFLGETFATRGNPPAVELDDHFTDRQPKTETFTGGINLFERMENFLKKLRSDSNTAVANLDAEQIRFRRLAPKSAAELKRDREFLKEQF